MKFEIQQQTKKLALAFLIGSICALVACSQGPAAPITQAAPAAAVKAAEHVEQSFAIVPVETSLKDSAGNIVPQNSYHLSIQRQALNKEFLLMGELIQQQPVPSFNGLKSRVVAFQEFDGKVYMLDANAGHQVSADIPQDLVLAAFPIVSENADTIVFDFNAGMTAIFAQGDWYAADDEGTTYKYQLSQAKIRLSYIKAAKISALSNTLAMDQVVQAEVEDDSGKSAISPAAVMYYLSPYNPDSSFVPSPLESSKRFGYFDVSPQLLADGSSRVYSSKWNIKGPIQYAISANTPEDFKKPIAEAVLYWNSVFGKDTVTVIQLTDKSITAPNPDYNIIQWVENDAAGAAYADAQMDPRTGQILHAQIYLTSVFADLGKIRGQTSLRDTSSGNFSHRYYGLKGFAQTGLCDYQIGNAVASSDLTVLAQDKATALKLAQDYVRETLAHEVGHTLGLRHNFAGNLGGNFDLKKRLDIFKQYLKDAQAPAGVITTSSIMDYELFEESTIMGDEVSRQTAHAEYDIKAIRHLYFGENPSQVPPFCTDGDLGKYQDCQQFDTGRSLPEYMLWQVQYNLNMAPVTLLNTYIKNAAPVMLGTQSLPTALVAIDPTASSINSLNQRFQAFRSLTAAGALIAVRSQYPFVNSTNIAAVKAAEDSYWTTQIAALGAMENLFAPIDDSFSASALAKLNTLLNTPGYASGTYGDKHFEFTTADKEIILANAKMYFDKMQAQLVSLDLASLSGLQPPPAPGSPADPNAPAASPLRSGGVSAEITPLLKARLEKYVFSTTGKTLATKLKVSKPDADGKTQLVEVEVKLPVFAYPKSIRITAVQLFNKGTSEDAGFGVAQRTLYANVLTALITKTMGVTADNIDLSTIPIEAANWLVENITLIGLLTNGGAGN